MDDAAAYHNERGPDPLRASLASAKHLFDHTRLPRQLPSTLSGIKSAQDRWLGRLMGPDRPRYIGSWNATWSPAQMQARQSDRMGCVQGLLNHLWRYESDGVRWFDPDRDSLYPDRIRRRPEGAPLAGGHGRADAPGTVWDHFLTPSLAAEVVF